jgi:hypothetical protein
VVRMARPHARKTRSHRPGYNSSAQTLRATEPRSSGKQPARFVAMAEAEFSFDELSKLPTCAGIYAIVHEASGLQYVGQAFNIRDRVVTHNRDLSTGVERTNSDMLLQRAWDMYGRDAFVVRVLEEVENNRSETHYHIRPDNLALAEHCYINLSDKSAYNKDKNIVHPKFHDLIRTKAWRSAIDEDTLARLRSATPKAYLVAKRVSWLYPVVVLAFDEVDAKREAARRDAAIEALGRNLSSKPLKGKEITNALAAGAKDLRHMRSPSDGPV